MNPLLCYRFFTKAPNPRLKIVPIKNTVYSCLSLICLKCQHPAVTGNSPFKKQYSVYEFKDLHLQQEQTDEEPTGKSEAWDLLTVRKRKMCKKPHPSIQTCISGWCCATKLLCYLLVNVMEALECIFIQTRWHKHFDLQVFDWYIFCFS